MTEDPRIGIVQRQSHDLISTDSAVALLAALDAAPKPFEPLGAHSEHLFDERCAECIPQEGQIAGTRPVIAVRLD